MATVEQYTPSAWTVPEPSKPPLHTPPPGPRRRAGLARRSRRIVLWGLAVYALAQTALTLVCDRWPTAAENLWWKKWRELQAHVARLPDRPLLVILGSSRAEAGIQPKL